MVPGGLIALSCFLQRWGIKRCIETFQTLSKQCFPKMSMPEAIQSIQRIAKCWIWGEIYATHKLEDTLKEQFGQKRMFDHWQTPSRLKVAVTGTTVSQASPVLLSNYNGDRKRLEACGRREFSSSKAHPY